MRRSASTLACWPRMGWPTSPVSVPSAMISSLAWFSSKPRCARHARGEGREAAGDECRIGAMRLHGGDQRAPARHVGDPLTDDPVDDRRVEALQQLHPLGQRALEIELAPHGAERDVLDALAHARHRRPARRCIPAGSWSNPCRRSAGACGGCGSRPRRHRWESARMSTMNSGSRSKSGTSQASPSASQWGAPPPRSRSSPTTSGPIAREPGAAMRTRTESMMTTAFQKRALLIAGPTASGKSALALELAQERGGVIINADALQVYAPLRILSARPTPEEEAHVPHRLYGHVGGGAALFGRGLARRSPARDGGGLGAGPAPHRHGRHRALFHARWNAGLAPVPEIPEEVRSRWRSFTGDLHAELAAARPRHGRAAAARRPAARDARARSGRRHRPLAARLAARGAGGCRAGGRRGGAHLHGRAARGAPCARGAALRQDDGRRRAGGGARADASRSRRCP